VRESVSAMTAEQPCEAFVSKGTAGDDGDVQRAIASIIIHRMYSEPGMSLVLTSQRVLPPDGR